MGCKGCEKKTSRYSNLTKMPADIDTVEEVLPSKPAPGFSPPVGEAPIDYNNPQQQDPFASFFAARALSYEELTARRQFQQNVMEQQAEQVMLQMTDDMKQVHIDELIAVVNCEKMSVPGMTPQQAIVSLQETLEREDFSFIEVLYPGLKGAVNAQYISIISTRLPGRKKE